MYLYNEMDRQQMSRCWAVSWIFLKIIILFGIVTSALAACKGVEENDYDMQTLIWTEWYSNDDPVSGGEDYERKSDIYPRDRRCTGEPTDVQCRAKYSKINYDATGDAGVTCSTTDGLRCQNSAQGAGGTCLDYEIRFQCQDIMPFPIPEYHLDLSGKTNLDDMDPVKCDSIGYSVIDRENRLSGTVYDNRLFYLQDGPPQADHSCTLWTGSTSVIDLFPLVNGICISEPLCCQEGLTVDFWAYTPATQGVAFTSIFGSGGHADGKVGIAVHIREYNSSSPMYLEFALRYSEGASAYHILVHMPEDYVIGRWFHFTGVFDVMARTACLYIDGEDNTLNGCKSPYLLHSSVTTVNYDNMRLFDRVYANTVASKRSPNAKFSDMKIYFSAMNAAQVEELHRRQTADANVHVYYIGLVSDPHYEDVVLECKAHGSEGDTIELRWLTTSDGVEFFEIDPASDPDIFVYNENLMNNYQYVSRLHFINHIKQTTQYACEGYDPTTMRTSSQTFHLTFTSGDTTWTPWISLDSPDDDSDDIESLANIRTVYPQVCSEPIDVECRTIYNKGDSDFTGQIFLHACTTTDGLHCIGSSQTGNRCFDYEVRFLCPGVNYRWTDWFDADDGGSSDDNETLSNHKLQGYAGLCEFPLFAECRTVADALWYDVTNIQLQYPYICTKEGLYCNKDDNSGTCPDFKVRYACPYYPGVYPAYKWELGGRALLTDEFPTDCGSLSEDTFLSTIPAGSTNGSSSVPASFTSAPSSVEAHCSPILDGSMYLNLGDFTSSCVTDASLCSEGATFTFWFQRRAASGAENSYFISTGSQTETSKGLAFYQEPSDGNLIIRVKTRFKAWDAIVDNSEFPLNNWKHVIISITPFVGISYYIDGVLKETVTEYSSSTYSIEYPTAKTIFVLGAENYNLLEYGNCAFSDIRVYESALQESHVDAFTVCGEADGQVDVTVALASHPLNPTRTLECQIWGSPAPTIEWVWLGDIDQPGLPSAVGAGASINEVNSVVGCWKTSTLTIPNYASSIYADTDIICKASNDVEFDLHYIHVDPVQTCELSLGVSSVAWKAIQFEDSVLGTLTDVPGLDGMFSWDQQSSSDLIIHLGVNHMIVGIALQVHQDPSGSPYAPSVDIDYEDDSEIWQDYESFTLDMIDASAASTQWFSFSSPQNTSKLRITPTAWSSGTQLRIDLYGCQVEDIPHELNLTGGYDHMTNTFTAVCTSSFYPAPILTWQYSGGTPDPGRYSEDTTVGIVVSTSTLDIIPFEVGDDNISFSCISTSDQGVMSDSMVTDYGFSGSVVLTGPSVVAIGNPFMLTCDVSGDDLYNLDWYFQPDGTGMASLVTEDVPNGITLSDTSSLVPAGGTATLSFTAMDSSYSGIYICSVNNGTNSDSLEVLEYVIPGNVSVTRNTSVYDWTTNSFILSCEFDYDGDFLNTSWIVPDMMDEIFGNWSNSKLDVVSLGSSSSLTIQSFNFSMDDGEYTCRGRTSGGGEVDYNFTLHYEFTGTVTLTTNYVVQNDEGVLVCQIDGDMVYEVFWYFIAEGSSVVLPIEKSGTTWTSNSTQGVGSMFVISEFRINSWPRENDGTYFCVVNQGSGQDSVLVKGATLDSISVMTSCNASADICTLTCLIAYTSITPNITWYAPPIVSEISPGDVFGRISVSKEDNLGEISSTLIITAADPSTDNINYTCRGSLFNVSSMQNTTELFVPIANEASIVQLEGDYNNTLQQYWLECTVTFTGSHPDILWVTPAGDIVSATSNKFTLTEELNGNNITSILLVNSSNFEEDDGIYTCHASQDSILKHTEDVSIFQAYLGPLNIFLTTSITLGDAVILKCVAGDPETAFDIQWYHRPFISPATAQPITDSPLYDVTVQTNAEGLVSHLQVNLFSLKENGVYICSVNGGSGELNLTVEGTKGAVGVYGMSSRCCLQYISHGQMDGLIQELLTNLFRSYL